MRVSRRRVLVGAGGAVAAALAGCTSAAQRAEELSEAVAREVRPGGHPLEGTATVDVVDHSESPHDLEAMTREALAFWEENAPAYAGFAVAFEVVDPADGGETPDVEIRYVDDRAELSGCRDHDDDVLGCAPIVPGGARLQRPANVEVVAGRRPYGEVLLTVKHEVGHVLGLDHDDEPAWIMSNDIRDRLPEYDTRVAVLEAIEDAWRDRNDATRTYNEGIRRWNDEAYDRAAETFREAEAQYLGALEHVETAEDAARAFEDMERPETVDREALHQGFERTREALELAAEAADHMAAASVAAADRRWSDARERQEAANDAIQAHQAVDTPTPNEIAIALGLVRESEVPGEDAEPGQG